ncbi:MAG: 3-hydroxyanthranilate 3,4-dioxygenase [Ignavibacteria bacterium]|nr:3-hydroxyanthranilate 3,4-dioxygenase [Ignavibacteria bacterium]
MAVVPPLNLHRWIEEHRDLLKPPVGNATIYQDADFIVMVVGGPNSRKDYHFNEGEELFYQIEGDITVKIIDEGVARDIHIRQGDMFLLPPRTPHSPQRPAHTVGLVIERKRKESELDGFMWFCESCGHMLYEEKMPLTNIVIDLPKVFDRYYGNQEHQSCSVCHAVMQPPTPAH